MYWIKNAIKKPGALHKELGVPMGKKIPKDKLEKAAHAKGKEGKRARLAETLESMHHNKDVEKHKKMMQHHHEKMIHHKEMIKKSEHEAGVKGDKKLHEKAVHHHKKEKEDKVKKVMKEFSKGDLHSSSKSGPIVTNPKQALAIGYSEAKRKK